MSGYADGGKHLWVCNILSFSKICCKKPLFHFRLPPVPVPQLNKPVGIKGIGHYRLLKAVFQTHFSRHVSYITHHLASVSL